MNAGPSTDLYPSFISAPMPILPSHSAANTKVPLPNHRCRQDILRYLSFGKNPPRISTVSLVEIKIQVIQCANLKTTSAEKTREDWGRRTLIAYEPTYLGKERLEWFETISTELFGDHESCQNLSTSS